MSPEIKYPRQKATLCQLFMVESTTESTPDTSATLNQLFKIELTLELVGGEEGGGYQLQKPVMNFFFVIQLTISFA